MPAARVIPPLLLLCLSVPAWGEGPSLRLGGELGGGYDSNLGNASDSAGPRDSPFYAGAVQTEFAVPLSRFAQVSLRGRVDGELYERQDGLDNFKAAALLRGMWKPGGDFFVPTLIAWGSAAGWEFDTRMRDSTEYRGGVALDAPLNTALRWRLGATVSRRDALSRVFDLRGRSLNLSLDWRPAPRWSVLGAWQYYRGDVASTSAPSPQARDAAQVREPDDALGPGQIAYRLGATSHLGTLDLNFALSRRLSFDLQQQYIATSAQGSNHYTRWVTLAGLLLRI